MRRILHTFETHREAFEALKRFAGEHSGAVVSSVNMTVTKDTEQHSFVGLSDDFDMSRLLGSEWHEARMHEAILPEYRQRVLCRVGLKKVAE